MWTFDTLVILLCVIFDRNIGSANTAAIRIDRESEWQPVSMPIFPNSEKEKKREKKNSIIFSKMVLVFWSYSCTCGMFRWIMCFSFFFAIPTLCGLYKWNINWEKRETMPICGGQPRFIFPFFDSNRIDEHRKCFRKTENQNRHIRRLFQLENNLMLTMRPVDLNLHYLTAHSEIKSDAVFRNTYSQIAECFACVKRHFIIFISAPLRISSSSKRKIKSIHCNNRWLNWTSENKTVNDVQNEEGRNGEEERANGKIRHNLRVKREFVFRPVISIRVC